MAFNFGNWLEEAWANVNPFDGGKTGASVRATRKAPPATLPAPKQRQASPLQMGSSNAPSRLNIGTSQPQQRLQVKTPTVSANKLLRVSGAKPTVQKPNWFQENIVDPTVRDANKAINTIAVPFTGLAGANAVIGDQLFNGGRNTQNLLKATQAQVDQNVKNSFVPTRVAKGKASPLEFGTEFTKTGVELAPYAVAGGSGRLAAPLSKTVGGAVAARAGSKLVGNIAGKAAAATADAAIAAPTFAGLDAARQGITAVQNGGQTGFDPLEAVRAGAAAGLMAGGGRIAGDTVMGTARLGARGVQTTAKAVQEATPTNLAAKDPRVLGFDEDIMKLQQAFDTTPDPRARQQINRAITNARLQRQATYNGVLRELSQGGFVAGPLAGDFSKAKKAGLVFDGVDGKPRFEVDDSGAKLKVESLNPANKLTNLESQYGMLLQMKKMGVNNPDIDARLKVIPEEIRQAKLASKSTKKLKLSDVLDHEEMYKQYPELKDVNVKVVNNRPFETKAVYDPRTNTVELNKKRLDTDPEDVKSNILHEVQHAIQEKEGFATGGYDKNMDTYRNLAGEAEARAVQARMDMPMSERYVKPEVDPSKAPEKWQGLIKDSREFTNPDDFVKSKQMDYHGTEQSFKRFSNSAIGSRGEPGFAGKGFYFTNRKNYAREYGKNVMEAHLNIKNPYVLDNAPGGFGVPYSPELIKERLKLPSDATPADITKKLKDMGHDGVVVNVIDASGRKKNGFEKMVIDAEDIWNPETLKALHEKTRPRSTFYDSLDVPKKDLIIRNGEGKAMSIEPKPTLQDALQGKSTKLPKEKLERIDEATSQFIQEESAKYNSVDELAAQLADDIYKANKGGAGSSIVQQDDLGRGGFRVSNNTPFYQAFKKETGKAPTKAEVRRMVDDFLDGEDNAVGYEIPTEARGIADTIKERTSSLDSKLAAMNAKEAAEYKKQFDGSGKLPIQDVVAPKIKQTRTAGKNVPVRKLEREGDIVTATNVNPNLKNVSEKRYSVADDGELIPDKKGATSVFTDKEGRVKNIRVGDKVYGREDFGDLSDVNGYASTLATMRRNVERGFGKETGDKLGKFLVDHQQTQVTKMVERKVALNEGLKQVANDLGLNFKTRTKYSKKVSAAIQDYGEGARDKASLVDEFGQEQADKIVAADKWFRKQYNDMLSEANAVLKQYGYDPIPKRKNYYTHFQDESVWQKFGLKMTEVRRTLGDPTMQDAMPDATRGKIDNKLAGMSEFTQPNKKFNPFALQRKGEAHTSDAFQAFERYMEPTLNNIYMTESITRARTVSRAIAQDANVMGKDANAILVQMKEWANDLAGKSNRFDRPIIDSRMGNNVLKVSQWMQKKAGQNTIVGNLSTAVMQPIVMAQTAGKFGYKNTTLGLLKSVGKESPEMAQSGFLKRRYANLRRVTEGKMDTARNTANLPLEVIEETATRATWEAALLDGKSKGLAGSKLISYADNATEKTVAGRSLGEKPELFRSKAAGFLTQYQLEVNNYWQQLGKEMTKKQALKVFVAAYGINSLLQATTGRRVGFDPISAAIDMWDESQKEEKSNKDKLVTAGQRAVGEVADNVPFAGMALSTVMGDKAYKNFVGKDSQGGRFGVSSPFSTLVSNPINTVLPFGGSQLKKTVEGGMALYDGKLTNKDGKTIVDIPQTPGNIARGLLFGKSAIPEVNQYYNNLEKKKVDQKPVQNQKNSLAGTQSLKGLTMAQQKELQSTPEYAQNALRGKFLAENKAKRTETAKKSTMSASEKKSYAKDKRIDGYIADNVSKETNATLTKYYGMKENEREQWFRKENDAQYKYWLAKYENDKANGKISKIEEVKWQYNLKKDKVGAKYSKDTRDLYGMAKYKIADFIYKDKNGKKYAEELLAYDKALYDAGITKYMKFRYGFGTTSGGRSGGRGGRKSTRNGAKKFSYSLTEFAPKKTSSRNKTLYDMLKQARKKYA